jgi:hypothetical protein
LRPAGSPRWPAPPAPPAAAAAAARDICARPKTWRWVGSLAPIVGSIVVSIKRGQPCVECAGYQATASEVWTPLRCAWKEGWAAVGGE